ncbi:MAG: enoyl-CoA hydratase/isomerase family protein [Synergistaceae bacterium]|nr:enoyl-CoA hydratase/isomerase family protein [Synergistaceae bacterium]
MQYIDLKIDDDIALIKFNRPEALNALNKLMLDEFEEALIKTLNDKDIKGVILTGEGKSFIAGADIAEFLDMNAHDAVSFAEFGQNNICGRIENAPKPVIAAINGYCIGGGNEIAMACDIRLASSDAVFSQPEAAIGILPMWGGFRRLIRLAGLGKAKELILTCRKVKADEALSIGLVNKIIEDKDKLLDEAYSMMKNILANAPIAVKLGKAALNYAAEFNIHDANDLERKLSNILFASEDKREGVKAFIEKRRAEYKGE